MRKQYAKNITWLLGEDQRIGNQYRSTPSRYAQEMMKFDLSAQYYPHDFIEAYKRHIEAWSWSGRIKDARTKLASDENVSATIVASILSSLFETDDTPIQDALEADLKLQQAEKDASNAIRNTFSHVKSIAISYGATLP